MVIDPHKDQPDDQAARVNNSVEIPRSVVAGPP